MTKQVEARHYEFGRYMSLPRWNSIWQQLTLVSTLGGDNILEVGPGPGLFKMVANHIGFHVETVDQDPELEPDHLGDVLGLPLNDSSYDVTCAFQVLEHLPFDDALKALDELARVARNYVVISLPDAERTWRFIIHLPKLGERAILLPRPRLSRSIHKFDGEHYWELNKRGHETKKVISAFLKSRKLDLVRTFRSFENPCHRFFVFSVAD